MPSIALSTYSIRVKKDRVNEFAITSKIGTEGQSLDLMDLWREFFAELRKDVVHDIENKKVSIVTSLEESERYIFGTVLAGEYGYESTLYNVDTKAMSFREKQQAEMLPFYFLVYVPEERDEGFIILQKFGKFGAKTRIVDGFKKFFGDKVQGFHIENKMLMPKAVLEKYIAKLTDNVKSISFTTFQLPDSLEENLRKMGHEEKECHLEYRLAANRSKFLGFGLGRWVKDVILGTRPVNSIIELAPFKPYSTKVEIEIAGKMTIIDLEHIADLRSSFPIDDRVIIDENGHPNLGSIHTVALDLLRDLLPMIYGESA